MKLTVYAAAEFEIRPDAPWEPSLPSRADFGKLTVGPGAKLVAKEASQITLHIDSCVQGTTIDAMCGLQAVDLNGRSGSAAPRYAESGTAYWTLPSGSGFALLNGTSEPIVIEGFALSIS